MLSDNYKINYRVVSKPRAGMYDAYLYLDDRLVWQGSVMTKSGAKAWAEEVKAELKAYLDSGVANGDEINWL